MRCGPSILVRSVRGFWGFSERARPNGVNYWITRQYNNSEPTRFSAVKPKVWVVPAFMVRERSFDMSPSQVANTPLENTLRNSARSSLPHFASSRPTASSVVSQPKDTTSVVKLAARTAASTSERFSRPLWISRYCRFLQCFVMCFSTSLRKSACLFKVARVILPLDLLTHACTALDQTGLDAPDKSRLIQRSGIEVRNCFQCFETPSKWLLHHQSLACAMAQEKSLHDVFEAQIFGHHLCKLHRQYQ